MKISYLLGIDLKWIYHLKSMLLGIEITCSVKSPTPHRLGKHPLWRVAQGGQGKYSQVSLLPTVSVKNIANVNDLLPTGL